MRSDRVRGGRGVSETLGYVPVDEGAIVRDRVAGATYAELTARYGVAGGQLKTILRKYGLHGSPKLREMVPAGVQARMVVLRAAGVSRRVIALETGWSEGAVERAVLRAKREAK